jgi:molybdopterin molybdotransferase
MAPREVTLAEAAGLTLGEQVVMDIDAPPFSRALVDGYAVRSVDAVAGSVLHMIGKVDAGGSIEGIKIHAGECVAINTGAPLIPGADAVVMVEETQIQTQTPSTTVKILKAISPGGGIQKQGSDAKSGDVVLPAGTKLTPAALAVAASAGRTHLKVANPRPVVALLITGDELVPIDHVPGPAQIRNSNQTLLRALIEQAGGIVMDLGVARDQAIALRLELARGLTEADVLVVTGGMSMGTKDLVPKLLLELGVSAHIEKLKMRPGKPFVFGTVEETGTRRYVCGLPGNPVSAFVCFCRLVAPLLAALSPCARGFTVEKAIAGADLSANGEREFYQPCTLADSIATPLKWKGSADLFTLSRADGLIVHPINSQARIKGSQIEVVRL